MAKRNPYTTKQKLQKSANNWRERFRLMRNKLIKTQYRARLLLKTLKEIEKLSALDKVPSPEAAVQFVHSKAEIILRDYKHESFEDKAIGHFQQMHNTILAAMRLSDIVFPVWPEAVPYFWGGSREEWFDVVSDLKRKLTALIDEDVRRAK